MIIILRKLWFFFILSLVRLGLYFFYQKISVTGKENIPKGKPIIFAANHENTFIDAFLIVTRNFILTNFLVRADVFRFRLARWFFSTLNMLPVYRIRDGFSSLRSNNVIFDACYEAFAKGESLIMFPEADHDIRRIPRKLTKGISRVALGAMNDKNGPKELYIIPVGLIYTAHGKFRSSVQINFGAPISIKKEPLENKYLGAIRNEVQEGLEKMHIGLPLENYDLLDNLIFGIEGDMNTADYAHINEQGKRLNEYILQEKNIDILRKRSKKFTELKAKFGIKALQNKTLFLSIIWSMLLFPIYMTGIIANGIVLFMIYLTDKVLIKNKIFVGSINFTMGLFLFPTLWYFQCTYLKEIFSDNSIMYLCLLLMPVSLVAFQIIQDYYSYVKGMIRFYFDKKSAAEFEESRIYLKAFKERCLGTIKKTDR